MTPVFKTMRASALGKTTRVSKKKSSKSGKHRDVEHVDNPGTYVLFEHQEFAQFMMDCNKRLGIFYDMGTGKTAIALTWILRNLKDGTIPDALILCPASLVPSWEHAVDTLHMFKGVSEDDVRLMQDRVTIVSFQRSYERIKLRNRDGTPKLDKNGKPVVETQIRSEYDRRWGAVFVDESHCIGSYKSNQFYAALAFAQLTEYAFPMSGTPVHGGGGKEDFAKMYGQIRFIEPTMWPTWAEFCSECVTHFDNFNKPRSYNVSHCRDILSRYGISCRITDVRDMPPVTDCMVPCELAEEKVYKNISEGAWAQYGLDIKMAGGKFGKLMQLCSGFLIRGETTVEEDMGTITFGRTRTVDRYDTGKKAVLSDIVGGCDGKIVVFCNFTPSVDLCMEVCRKAGRKAVRYDGSAPADAWKEFQYGDADAIVCQYQRGGVGIDLYAACNQVFFEPCFSALLFEQAKRRIFRTGQTHPCVYHYMYTPGTVEQKVLRNVMNGVDVTNEMMEEWSANGIM